MFNSFSSLASRIGITVFAFALSATCLLAAAAPVTVIG